ncbi:MAG: glycosyl hydrolase 53 family protein [Ferruginibacter sp.]|nr:glycosyl hydrolase 53 family protein [Ferruginibacter sp.]
MKLIQVLFQFLLLCTIPECKKSGASTYTTVTPASIVPVTPVTFFAKGADVSWVTEMEAAGIKFHNNTGAEKECMQLMKDLGLNAIRLRVWVNPANNWCNTADVLAKAIRANNLGMKILLDFHYSDVWADPGNQGKPAAWASQDFATLKASVYQHTYNVMNVLKTNGITPAWVQVGNETNNGMLWPEGQASTNMAGFTQLINSGYDAVKAVSSVSKVMVHISNGYDNGLFRWIFDGLKANAGKWDVIGMSLYPTAANWASTNTQCLVNMNDIITRFGKEIMICEVGMSRDQATASKAFITDIIAKNRSLANNKGLGVFYWEPEAHSNWVGYSLGAFDNTGKPTAAMDAFY